MKSSLVTAVVTPLQWSGNKVITKHCLEWVSRKCIELKEMIPHNTYVIICTVDCWLITVALCTLNLS